MSPNKKNKEKKQEPASASSMSVREVSISHTILTGIFSIDGTYPLSCVLAEYLDLKAIRSLDTAVCNIFLRPLYLDAVRHLTMTTIVIDSIEFTRWIVLRGIKTKELTSCNCIKKRTIGKSLVMMAEASYGFYKSIRKLNFINEKVDYAIIMSVFLKCENLEHLSFYADDFSLDYFKLVIPVFKKHKYLNMNGLNRKNQNFDSSFVKFLSSNCTGLNTLILNNHMPGLLDDSALLSITNGLTSLTCFFIHNFCPHRFYLFSEAALTCLKGLKMLQKLHLESIPNLTTPLLMKICHGCDKIVKLGLWHMPGLTNLSFESLGRLVSLDLGNVPATDATIQSIATHCSKLEYLGLVGATEITDIAIDYLTNGVCQSLKILDLRGCTRVTALPQKINAISIKPVMKIVVEG